jgi:hypothetical protein
MFKTSLRQSTALRWGLFGFAALFLAGFLVRSQSIRVKPLVASPETFVVEDRVIEGKKVVWKTHLYNPNALALEIKGVSVSCGCTKVGQVPKEIKSGEILPLEFVVNTEAMDGEKVLRSTVEAFARGRALTLNLSCKIDVAKSLHAIPSAVTLGVLKPQSKVQVPVSLWDALPDGYSLLDSVTVSDTARVQVEWKPVSVDEKQGGANVRDSRAVVKRYELLVSYSAELQMRSRERIAEEIALNIEAGGSKLMRRIPISGSVIPDIEFLPPDGLLGSGRDAGVSRVIVNKRPLSELPTIVGAVGCKASIAEDHSGQLLLRYEREPHSDTVEDSLVNIRFGEQDIVFPIKRVVSLK